MACLLDVTAAKPGNVHRGADFEDMGMLDFAASAVAIGPAMEGAGHTRLGETVLRAVRATREVTKANTNLGIVLLLAPLAKVAGSARRRQSLQQLWSELTAEDCSGVYEAIRLASPGGLGESEQMDVRSTETPTCLMTAMEHAADRDLVALQYVSDFELVLKTLVPQLVANCREQTIPLAIVDTFVWLLANHVDSLIQRKCGKALAQQASELAIRCLEARESGEPEYHKSLAELDFWLRADGNRRNPGTSADLVTAATFMALNDGLIEFV